VNVWKSMLRSNQRHFKRLTLSMAG
jgi:hypothetical protein